MSVITSETRVFTFTVRFPTSRGGSDQPSITRYLWANATTPADKGEGRATDDIPPVEPSTPGEMSE